MKINVTSVLVDDQQKALEFYTRKLGFIKKEDTPMGQYRWLSLVSSEGAEGVELLLEPLAFGPASSYQKALYDAGIPAMAFESTDLRKEIERLEKLGVHFRSGPETMGQVDVAVFEDTCGNLICLTEKH